MPPTSDQPAVPSPSALRRFAHEVVRRLREAGHEAYWAGGCVRDELLGLVPKDYDVATNARPDEIRRLFGYRRTLAVGAAFGVVTVLGRSRRAGQIEVATFRRDAEYSDGRHPNYVTFSTPHEDALRRDFTINGMFYDPLDERVIDFVGGQQDLQRGVVRAIGDPDERFSEDKLRLLRAVRIAASFDFQLDPRTLAAIQRRSREVRQVSAERIAGELRRMLVHQRRRRALELLRESNLLEALLPELAAHPASAAWARTLAIVERLDEPSFPMSLAGLLHPAAEPPGPQQLAQEVARRWRLSRDERQTTEYLLAEEAAIRRAAELPWPRIQRLLTTPGIDGLLRLAAAVGDVLDGHHRGVDWCRERLRLPPETLDPPPLVSGHDLKQLGLAPGPPFRRILTEVRDAQLEQRVRTRDEALELARRLAAEAS